MPSLVHKKTKPARRKPGAQASGTSDCGGGGCDVQHKVLGLLALEQRSTNSKGYASVLGSYDTAEEANERVREELYRVKAYVQTAYGSSLAASVSKQAQSKETNGMLQLTAPLQSIVSRKDSFRWQTLTPGAEHGKIAREFLKDASEVEWVDESHFTDGLDLWIAV
mmetsp:Transcript_25480/g.49950  ORF Transcript_25480/g.49950 Transcript_25480/m.49950 type:complete len:166 (+) Transcript_25480:58-555(+)